MKLFNFLAFTSLMFLPLYIGPFLQLLFRRNNFKISIKLYPFKISNIFFVQTMTHAVWQKMLVKVENLTFRKKKGEWKFIVKISQIKLRIMTRWVGIDPIKNNMLGLKGGEFIAQAQKTIWEILNFGYIFDQETDMLNKGDP